MTVSSSVCPVLVGRDAEVKLLAEYAGRGAVTLIAGPAGVGKTRLAAEALEMATGKGVPILLGHCRPEPTVPFASFVTALRRRTRTLDQGSLVELFGGSALLSAALLPEAATAVGLPREAPRQDDLFAAVWQLFKRLSGPDGGLLLIEDLHWADTDSLKLFCYLAEEISDLGLWLVATYRSDEIHRRHPLASVLKELGRSRAYEEIVLNPLGRESLRDMVSAIFDRTEVGDQFLDLLAERTQGNPFFVEELVKVLLDRGDIYWEAGDWARRELAEIELPESVRETLLSRARTLLPGQFELLELAALAGDQLDLPMLGLAAGSDRQVLEETVRRGLGLQLLVERHDGASVSYAFRHALTREAFADELVGPDRQRAHLRLAEAIEVAHRDNPDPVSAELADHFAAAGERERAIEFGERAAQFAVTSYAHDEAARRYDMLLRLVPAGAQARLFLLLEAAEALREASDQRLLVSLATEALAIARARADYISQSRALAITSQNAWLAGDTPKAVSLAEEAFGLIRERDDGQEAIIIGLLTRLLALADRYKEASELIPRGLDLATRTGNLTTLSRLHGTRCLITVSGPEFEEALQAAIGAARAGNDARSEWVAVSNAGYLCLWCGEFARAEELLDQALEVGERYFPNDRYVTAGMAWLLALTGRYDQCLALASAVGGDDHVPTRIVALTARYETAERRGDPQTAAIAEELWSIGSETGELQRSLPAASARARQALSTGDLDSALPLFWEALSATRTDDPRTGGYHWQFSPDLARALCHEGRTADLEAWADAIHTLTATWPIRYNTAADTLAGAYLLVAKEDFAAAHNQFDMAAASYRALPDPARETEALIGLADVELRMDHPDSSSAAGQGALELAERIGADALVHRARRLLERAQTPPILATVMFTDVVGSTERLSSVGDRAWNSVLERHHNIVRRELAKFMGREIDTTGDGFLATFDSPAQGIRCALAIQTALAHVGIKIRAGLHTGECQIFGNKLAGLAVHIAARVSATAEAGTVLVSRTVRDLVAGSGLQFQEHGTYHLKGVPGEWTLYRAVK